MYISTEHDSCKFQVAHTKPQTGWKFVHTLEQVVDYIHTDGWILILCKATSPPCSVNNDCMQMVRIIIRIALVELSLKGFVWSLCDVHFRRCSTGILDGWNSVIYTTSPSSCIELWPIIQTHYGNMWVATHLIFSRISRVGHMQNPYQSCWSHDRCISSVEHWT